MTERASSERTAPSRTLLWPSSSSAYGATASIMMRACSTSIVTWLVKISSASSGNPADFFKPSVSRT